MKLRKNSVYDSIQKNKYLGIRLTKKMPDLYTENCKTVKKKIIVYLNKCKGL